MKLCNKGIIKSLDLAKEMLILSDKGEALREGAGCGVFGLIRDTAYKIRQPAEEENDTHIKKWRWK